jgi:hypothetical protein
VVSLKTHEIKNAASALDELDKSYVDILHTVRGTIKEVKAAKKLWRDGNKSRLIKIGLALIVFPEPTPISETVGACFVAAGAIQKGIRSRSIYIDDVNKVFQDMLREVRSVNNSVQI